MRIHRLALIASLILYCLFQSCTDEPEAEGEAGAPLLSEAEFVEKMKIDGGTADILYTYMNERRKYVTVDSADRVPDPFRNDVIVVNLRLSPEERLSHKQVVVANLNSKTPEGFFEITLEDRLNFENAQKLKRQWRLTPAKALVSPAGAPQTRPPPFRPSRDIVLYTTSWCGYCRKVREFFKKHNIAYIEKDIEKDNRAVEELRNKCAMNGLDCSGVPVVDWRGVLIPGYDEASYLRMMKQPPAPGGMPPARGKPQSKPFR